MTRNTLTTWHSSPAGPNQPRPHRGLLHSHHNLYTKHMKEPAGPRPAHETPVLQSQTSTFADEGGAVSDDATKAVELASKDVALEAVGDVGEGRDEAREADALEGSLVTFIV